MQLKPLNATKRLSAIKRFGSLGDDPIVTDTPSGTTTFWGSTPTPAPVDTSAASSGWSLPAFSLPPLPDFLNQVTSLAQAGANIFATVQNAGAPVRVEAASPVTRLPGTVPGTFLQQPQLTKTQPAVSVGISQSTQSLMTWGAIGLGAIFILPKLFKAFSQKR